MRIRVMGIPQQQGSKTAFALPVVLYSLPRIPFTVRAKTVMKDANEEKLKPWRAEVKRVAGEAWGDTPLLTGPVKVRVSFVFPRPLSHFGTGRNADVLKASAPFYKISQPDGDKLERAIGDALTGVCIKDDALIAVWEVRKVYTHSSQPEPCADITVIDLSGGSHDEPRAGATVAGQDSGEADTGGADPVRG